MRFLIETVVTDLREGEHTFDVDGLTSTIADALKRLYLTVDNLTIHPQVADKISDMVNPPAIPAPEIPWRCKCMALNLQKSLTCYRCGGRRLDVTD